MEEYDELILNPEEEDINYLLLEVKDNYESFKEEMNIKYGYPSGLAYPYDDYQLIDLAALYAGCVYRLRKSEEDLKTYKDIWSPRHGFSTNTDNQIVQTIENNIESIKSDIKDILFAMSWYRKAHDSTGEFDRL